MKSGSTVFTLLLAFTFSMQSLFAQSAGGGDDPLKSSTVAEAEDQITIDIHKARRELAELNEQVSKERVSLVQQVDRLLKEVRDLESDLSDAEALESSLQIDLDEVRKETAFLDEVIGFIDDLGREYRRAFETRIHLAEAQLYENRLAEIDGILAAGTTLERLEAVPLLLELAEDHAVSQTGGRIFRGRALDMEGQVHEGLFALAGPVCYFAAPSPGPAGLVIQPLGSSNPTVYRNFSSDVTGESMRKLVQGETSTVPFDITLGEAVKLRQAQESFLDHAKKGGITMVPLLGLAGVCLLLALYKFFYLHRIRISGYEEEVASVLTELKEGRAEAAERIAGRLPKPLGSVISEGVRYKDFPKEHLEEILAERILAQVPSIERLLTPLAVCASAAPLLGLLGTVTGMIHTFKLITVFGTGDATRLSSGISEALVTTEFGLMIAIPALLIHAYLSRRARKAVSYAQQTALMFVNSLKLRQPR